MPGSRPDEEKYLFVVEYFDPMPRLKKQFLLKLYVEDMDIEMVDLGSKKLFLKRSPAPESVRRTDFFVGGKVLLYSRELDIVDYGDGYTRSKLAKELQSSVLLCPGSSSHSWGSLLDAGNGKGLTIASAKMVLFSSQQIAEVQSVLGTSNGLDDPAGVLILCMQGADGVQVARDVVESAGLSDKVLMSSSSEEATNLQGMLLGPKSDLQSSATLDSCTCCIIKPHAVREGLIGPILKHLTEQNYEISAFSTLYFNNESAEEFLEVYKGVVPEYSDHVVEFCGGMCVALELRAQDAVRTFRQTAGPWDVEMAKELRPNTIRGIYGTDRVRNVVHCTDLESDAVSECEYVFKILA